MLAGEKAFTQEQRNCSEYSRRCTEDIRKQPEG